jgi:molybdate transport system substrate-binding protein
MPRQHLCIRAASTRPARRVRTALLVAAALVLAAPAAAQAVTVYGAASLSSAFPRIDGSPRYSFAGSNQLQLQIERGAPADVFASASPAEPRALFREGRCSRPVTFATNVLVLVTPRSNPAHLRSVYSLRTGRHRLAVGTAGVPIGAYTRQVLRRMRLTSILTTNTVSLEPNVNSIIAKVGLGSADAGFAYASDWKAAASRVNRIALPARFQPPVRYQMCAVRRPGADTAGARRFMARVLSSRGRSTLKRFGFGITPRG